MQKGPKRSPEIKDKTIESQSYFFEKIMKRAKGQQPSREPTIQNFQR